MIDDKCKNCKELVIPYLLSGCGTCRCNVDAKDRYGIGYCGWCHPDLCRGSDHHYYFDYSTPKFID